MAVDKRKSGFSLNPKRIARLEQMQGLLTTALEILSAEYERHMGLSEGQIDAEAEKAAEIVKNYESMFGRKAA